MIKLGSINLTFSEVSHLPIIKAFVKKYIIVDTINHILESPMELLPGSKCVTELQYLSRVPFNATLFRCGSCCSLILSLFHFFKF